MRADTFQIAENQQNLQYYAYVRQVMQIKEISYWIGNPSVEIINGNIYFKPSPTLLTVKDLDSHQQYLREYKSAFVNSEGSDAQVVKTLALLGIPNNKTPIEVCERLQAYLDWIVQVRVVKTNHFKYYAMLLLLKDIEKATKLCTQIVGDEYNGLQIQRVLLRQMAEMTYTHTQASKVDIQPLFQHRKKSNIANEDSQQKITPEEIFIKSYSNKEIERQSISGMSPRRKQHPHKIVQSATSTKQSEQQTSCAICFQETEGTLISILCCHYFHVKCLSQWKQNICPLCRYHQHPPVIKFCQKCNQCEGLWVCLVCGVRLCCGQDHNILGDGSHIYEHYLESHHRLSMDIQTKFIFDASQPAFLHQMFYREVMKNDASGLESDQSNKKGKKNKLSEKISEYQQSISQEMQKQRAYFEQNISKQIKKRKQLVKEKKKLIAELQSEIAQLDKQSLQIDLKKQQFQNESANLEKQLKNLSETQKNLKQILDKNKYHNKRRQDEEMIQIKQIESLIAQKKQQLKDFKRNKDLSAKIKSNVGKDQIQSALIFDLGPKDSKKKKK